jgi:NitT/TauT family transport system ATP-binding protein
MGFHCEDLSKRYHTRERDLHAISGVNLSVEDEEFLCLIGPSGCGKSTLLKLIAGLLQPSGGKICFDTDPPAGKIRAGMVFQEQGLYPWMTVVENAAFGLECLGMTFHSARERAANFLVQLGLGEFLNEYPHQLSGGMRQRVAIARAILTDPQILLMDEPFGSLDAQTRMVLIDELLRIWSTYRKTVLYVTHDIEEALLLADRIVVLSGRPGTVLETIEVTTDRPRRKALRTDTNLASIRARIWELVEADVRQDLHIEEPTL